MVPLKSWSRKLRNLDSLCEEPRSLVYSAFISVSKSHMFGLGLGFSNKGLGVSASLGFYHSPPLCITSSIFAVQRLSRMYGVNTSVSHTVYI